MPAHPAVRWLWILALSFLAFWPIQSALEQHRAQKADRRYTWRGNLWEIGYGLADYRKAHNGRYPPTLMALYPDYIRWARVLIGPGDAGDDGNAFQRYGYLCEGGADGSEFTNNIPIAVYPYRLNEQEICFTVLFHDGQVRNCTCEIFCAAMAVQAKGGRHE